MGTITSMCCERFEGKREEIDDPTWKDAERALRRMDGETWWMLSFETDQAHLSLEGGLDGQFSVGWSKQSWDEHYVALHPKAAELDELDTIEIGGQTGEEEARKCVDLDTALTCVRAFFDAGQRAEGVGWERLP